MEFAWRCNDLKCRAQLDNLALVTTCSHIFCETCANSNGLANPHQGVRVCPACKTHLSNPDDAVVTQLNPTEDYKTSVLSGLHPRIIMECAERGLSFYGYQTNMEIAYQEFLARSLTDKYNNLSTEMDSIIHASNTEITSLRDKLSALHAEQKNLEEKNHQLADKFREKAKQHHNLMGMYHKLKQQQQVTGLESAADHDAEGLIYATSRRTDQAQGRSDPRQGAAHARAGSTGSGGSGGRRYSNGWEQQIQGHRAGLGSARNIPINLTPSRNCQRIPTANLYYGQGPQMRDGTGFDPLNQGPPVRQPLGNIDPNVNAGGYSQGYGMSAGVKIGRQPRAPVQRPGLHHAGGYGGLGIR